MDASSTKPVNILEIFDTNQYRIYKFDSAPAISISFDFRDLIKERLMCIVLYPNKVQITMCFLSRSLVTPQHRYVIMVMNEVDAYKDRFSVIFSLFFLADNLEIFICHFLVQRHYFKKQSLL